MSTSAGVDRVSGTALEYRRTDRAGPLTRAGVPLPFGARTRRRSEEDLDEPALERESMEVDVLYVGAGPATLASAIHLMNQVRRTTGARRAAGRPPIEPPTVLVLEKSASVGDHMLSGACMNPKAIRELVPDFEQQGFPTEYVCNYAGFWLFHPKGKLSVPFVPPNFQQEGLPRRLALQRRASGWPSAPRRRASRSIPASRATSS